MFKYANSIAKDLHADFHIYTSHTTDKKKNPLTYEEKLKYLKLGCPTYAKNVKETSLRTAFEIIEKELIPNYDKIVFMVGEDRYEEFKKGMSRYPTVEVQYIGRLPGAISASIMRKAAIEDDETTFLNGLPSGFTSRKKEALKLMTLLKDRLL